MNKKQRNYVISYFNNWISCSKSDNFDKLFFYDFNEIKEKSYQQEIVVAHIHLTYKFLYKEFVCKAEYEDLLNDFVKISQHCLHYCFNCKMPVSVFAKFQVSQYLKLFSEICKSPELLNKNLYKYWILTSKDQYNFRIDAYDLYNFSNISNIKNKWRFI